MVDAKRKNINIKERLAIYTLAAEKIQKVEKRNAGNALHKEETFMCNMVAAAAVELKLTPSSNAMRYETTKEYNTWLQSNFPELFLFHNCDMEPCDAWMSGQLLDDGITDVTKVNKVKRVALQLCAEMCR